MKMIAGSICLFDLKWKDGYLCRKCSCTTNCKGKTAFHLRCTQCGYDESVTAHTLFHKIKIPLLKAFGIMFRITVRKKGMSTVELANKYDINQKTSWLFKRKTQEAMKSNGANLLTGHVEVDELMIGGVDEGMRGRSKGDKIKQKPSDKGKNFKGLHVLIMNLKGWLRGIHHKCSAKFMNGYLDEFFFRFNRRNHLSSIWHKLTARMMQTVPYTCKANET